MKIHVGECPSMQETDTGAQVTAITQQTYMYEELGMPRLSKPSKLYGPARMPT